MGVDCRESYTAVVHLPSEDLIAKEIVAEDASITIRAVYAFVTSDIWKVTNHGMHTIVLLFHIVDM